MIDVRKWFGKEFSWRHYNCWDFLRDVWLDATGQDLGSRKPPEVSKDGFRRAFVEQQGDVENKLLQRIMEPVTPCVALLERPGVMSHVGIFMKGKLFHLHPDKGVVLEPMEVASLGFQQVKFYR